MIDLSFASIPSTAFLDVLIDKNEATPNHSEESAIVMSEENATYRVLYNQFNIDSCYAATLVAENALLANPSAKIHTVPIDYFNYQKSTNNASVLVLCGVNLTINSLLSELDSTMPKLVLCFQYNKGSDIGSVGYKHGRFLNITPNGSVNDDPEAVEHVSSDNSISVMVNEYFTTVFGGVEMNDTQARLMGVVANYVNMRPFPSIFEKKSDDERTKADMIVSGRIGLREKDDLSFLYRNMPAIEMMARMGKPHEVIVSEVETVRDYSANLTVAKNIIQRNMSEQIYSGKAKYFKAQTVCVSEENAYEVMRLLSLALETVMTYEDMQNYRVWRLISNDPSVLHTAKDALKPVMEWTDCKVHYLVTHLVAPMQMVKQ